MATYKVIQDIEAEDKLVGPFSLRQFIYAAIVLFTSFIAFKFASLSIFLIIPFAPVIILFAVLAAPFGRDQPSEIWLLAKIRFILKPHVRIWNQDGAINLVTVTAPKQTQKQLTKNLSRQEVTSRLQALANTIDSRGWAIKNVNVNLSAQDPYSPVDFSAQRLINPSSLPSDVPASDINPADDIMDSQNNPTAQHLDQMINASGQAHRAKVVASVVNPPVVEPENSPHPDYWFMNNGPGDVTLPRDFSNFKNTEVIAPGTDINTYAPKVDVNEEVAIMQQIQNKKNAEEAMFQNAHIEKSADHGGESAKKVSPTLTNDSVTPTPKTDIIEQALANRGNWSVQTQAKEAKKKEPPQDEVVISLH